MGPRFLVDINVGRLGKWLRILGYDTLLAPHLDDKALIRLAQEDGRILLTRDQRLIQRRMARSGSLRALLIRSDDLGTQLRQVVEEVGLNFSQHCSRCIECNEELAPVAKTEVWEQVPPYVYQSQDEFTRCLRCRRVYWRGTHWRNMQAELRRVQRGTP